MQRNFSQLLLDLMCKLCRYVHVTNRAKECDRATTRETIQLRMSGAT